MEFSHGSHIGPLKAVTTANGLVAVPYVFLSKTRNLKDIGVHLNQGGMYVQHISSESQQLTQDSMIAHPRLAFQVVSGFAIIYDCWRSKSPRKSNEPESAADDTVE